MLGIVFSEFSQLVEDQFSMDMLYDILEASNNPHDGAYTALGVYDHQELLAMVVALSQKSGFPEETLVQAFGKHLFGRFFALYPDFFRGCHSAFGFLEGIEATIHSQVQKLYPTAELPAIAWERPEEGILILKYRSSRPFANLAVGLVEGCMAHFKEPADVSMTGDGFKADILIRKIG